MAQCSATTTKGTRCRKHAVEGAELCAFHLSKVGRRTLLTEQVADQLVAMLKAGNYVTVATRAVGVSRRTFSEWMRRGKSDAPADAEFRVLRERVTKARAEAEVRHVAQISAAATDSWQAAAWMLERQYPDRWGRVSVRLREDAPPPAPEQELPLTVDDPFTEVDELAERRRNRNAT
jgi:hypothetical protein